MSDEQTAEFSLRMIIRQVLATEPSEDTDVLLKAVREAVPRNKKDTAYEQALLIALRSEMTSRRFAKGPSDEGLAEEPSGEGENGASGAVAEQDGTDRPEETGNGAALREHFSGYVERCLDERWTTSDGKKRRLRMFDAADCAYAAAKQRKLSRTHATFAGMFEGFQSAIGEHGVRFVGELPEAFLEQMFRGLR